jgi:hypothetical protein
MKETAVYKGETINTKHRIHKIENTHKLRKQTYEEYK